MTSNSDPLLDAITRIIPSTLTALEACERLQQNLHPQQISHLSGAIAPFEAELQADFDNFQRIDIPADFNDIGTTISQAATYALRACDGFSNNPEADFSLVMRALRAHCRAQEIIYSLAPVMTPVSQYFLEPAARANKALLGQLASQGQALPGGIISAENARNVRGGFSVYVPENLDPNMPASVVFALHGGTGHGADFLWSWLREARTRGFILVAPTSVADTWSLMGDDQDLRPLYAILAYLRGHWTLDTEHILLTGMSDGASYTLLAGLNAASPFTHLAPFSGVLHPDLVMRGQLQYAANKPIYLVHGDQDWMFPVEIAQMANAELSAAGAAVTYREIAGGSHQFARAECPALLTWFNPTLEVVDHA